MKSKSKNFLKGSLVFTFFLALFSIQSDVNAKVSLCGGVCGGSGGGGGPDTTSIARDGSRPPTADQPWGSFSLFDVNLLELEQIATPSNPAAGENRLYFKSDGYAYYLSSGGTERTVGYTVPTTNSTYLDSTPSISGTGNTGIGAGALDSVGAGNDSTAVGLNAGTANTSDDLVAIGVSAALTHTSGLRGTFVGRSAGAANVTGSDVTYVGHRAGVASSAPSGTFLGASAGARNTSGTPNIYIGQGNQGGTTGGSNVMIGTVSSVATTLDSNVCVGAGSCNAMVAAGANVAIGSTSGASMVSSTNNTFLGLGSGNASTGNDNTFVGRNAGISNVGGAGSTYLGRSAGSLATGGQNIAIGYSSQLSTAAATNELSVGSDTLAPVSIGYFGQGGAPSTAPAGFTFSTTSASGTNIVGGATTLTGGRSTGSAAGGSINFRTSPAGGAGSTLNALVTGGSMNSAGTWTLGAAGGTATHLSNGSLSLNVAGNGLLIKEGANATSGAVTLVAGTAVVSTTKVTASSRIQLTCNDPNGGTPGVEYISARTAATDFTITSAAADTCIIAWLIVEPG